MEPPPDQQPPILHAGVPPISPGRRRLALLVLGLYPLVLGLLPAFFAPASEGPMLPRDVTGLLAASGFELLVFAVVFGAAWLLSGAAKYELWLGWGGGAAPIWRGFIYSVILRVLIAMVMIMVVGFSVLSGLSPEEAIETSRARTEAVVDPGALNDPVYFFLTLTLISFVVAGFREELWRVGMLAMLQTAFPRLFGGTRGLVWAALVAALLFGLGHFPQGWGGMFVTAVLGMGLGLVMIRHRSLWEAVLAHGFFNATTFVLLYAISKMNPRLLPGGLAGF